MGCAVNRSLAGFLVFLLVLVIIQHLLVQVNYYYKNYFCKKHNIDPKNVETHFALLKRTAKKDRVEFFRVTSGPKKTENALNLLKKALYNITASRHIKNRLSCSKCEFLPFIPHTSQKLQKCAYLMFQKESS